VTSTGGAPVLLLMPMASHLLRRRVR